MSKTLNTTEKPSATAEKIAHTPEWKVKLISGSAVHRAGDSHDTQITVQVNAIGYGNQLDVVHLIAAAPDLLEVCKDAAAYLNLTPFAKEPYVDRLRAAIAKAEGRAE